MSPMTRSASPTNGLPESGGGRAGFDLWLAITPTVDGASHTTADLGHRIAAPAQTPAFNGQCPRLTVVNGVQPVRAN